MRTIRPNQFYRTARHGIIGRRMQFRFFFFFLNSFLREKKTLGPGCPDSSVGIKVVSTTSYTSAERVRVALATKNHRTIGPVSLTWVLRIYAELEQTWKCMSTHIEAIYLSIYLSVYTAWRPRGHFRQVCAVEQNEVENQLKRTDESKIVQEIKDNRLKW